MKKTTLIYGIVALMLTTVSADFSFGKMYEELKAVAEATDINVSNSTVDTDKNVTVDVATEINDEKESIKTESTDTTVEENKEKGTIETNLTVENISDKNITKTSTENNK